MLEGLEELPLVGVVTVVLIVGICLVIAGVAVTSLSPVAGRRA